MGVQILPFPPTRFACGKALMEARLYTEDDITLGIRGYMIQSKTPTTKEDRDLTCAEVLAYIETAWELRNKEKVKE